MSDAPDTDESDDDSGHASKNQRNCHNLKHGLYADREIFYENLDDRERQLVVDIAEDLLERYDGDVGSYEREAIRNVAIDTIKRWRYNEHMLGLEDLVEHDESERASRAYERLRKNTTSELKDLGLLENNPEQRKADAAQSWMSQISEAKDATESDDGAN